jgi:hypothetical protein
MIVGRRAALGVLALSGALALPVSAHATVWYLRCRSAPGPDPLRNDLVFEMNTYDRSTDCEAVRTGIANVCEIERARGRRVQIDCNHCICASESWISP